MRLGDSRCQCRCVVTAYLRPTSSPSPENYMQGWEPTYKFAPYLVNKHRNCCVWTIIVKVQSLENSFSFFFCDRKRIPYVYSPSMSLYSQASLSSVSVTYNFRRKQSTQMQSLLGSQVLEISKDARKRITRGVCEGVLSLANSPPTFISLLSPTFSVNSTSVK